MKFGNENKEIGQKFIHSCEVDTIKVTKLRDLKCDNWVKENLLMIGDSAHAVLPFHGQGANAAMEDALILSNLIPDFKDGNEVNWNKIFHSFFKKRKPDADALLQLGRLNHFSMIGNDSRQIEKHDIKLKLEEFYNNDFESEYHMVTFSDKSYSAALKRFYSEDALATYILDYHEQNEKYRFKNANEEIKADTKRLIIKHKMLETEQADMLNQIKHQYQFQNDKELEVLLEGLSSKESQGVTYWDYVETDTLLSLQKPKTFYPDEVIFITYHQLCELYFKLIIQEIERLNDFYENDIAKKVYKISHINFLKDKEGKVVQGDDGKNIIVELDELETWTECFKRVERYWQNLITSFDVLKSGLSTAEFLEFRKALLPASGFQTYQFRKMELMLTPLRNLTIPTSENEHEIYWRKGAMNKTGSYQESKLLKNFNAKYDNVFFDLVNFFKGKTILDRFEALNSELQKEIKPMLVRTENTILLWKVAHMHMIYQHIPSTESATGGTDYINYLPQLREYKTKVVEFNKKYQVLYFPDFWKDRNANEYISKLIADLPIEISKVIAKLYAGDNPTQTKRPE